MATGLQRKPEKLMGAARRKGKGRPSGFWFLPKGHPPKKVFDSRTLDAIYPRHVCVDLWGYAFITPIPTGNGMAGIRHVGAMDTANPGK